MLRTLPAARLSAVLVAVTIAAATAGGGPAYAVERCKVSSKTVDNPAYGGPLPDNWDFTVKACVTTSGANIRHWATISWDLPESSSRAGSIFNVTGTNAEVTAMIEGGWCDGDEAHRSGPAPEPGEGRVHHSRVLLLTLVKPGAPLHRRDRVPRLEGRREGTPRSCTWPIPPPSPARPVEACRPGGRCPRPGRRSSRLTSSQRAGRVCRAGDWSSGGRARSRGQAMRSWGQATVTRRT